MQSKIRLLTLDIVSLQFVHRSGKLRRIKRRRHMFVSNERGQFEIKRIRMAVLCRLRLLSQSRHEGRRDLLQSVMAEISLGREICQLAGQPELVGSNRKLPDRQRQFAGRARSHVIR